MNDRTVTETAFDSVAHHARPRVPGLLALFVQDICTPVPWRLEAPRTIGRDASADLSVQDSSVSRVHALIEPTDGGVLVTDQGSHNGSFINGVKVTAPRTPAAYGSVVRLAKTLLYVTDDVVGFESQPPFEHPSLAGGPSLDEARLGIATVGPSNDPVLLEAETGTGKEVVAQVIHEASGRPGPFVAVNCAALAPEIVESELFGHAKGAFSGSSGARTGLFRSAEGGTLLLDEVGELTPAVQAKLLRVIETCEVRAVGEDRPVQVDVRIIGATNRGLDEMVSTGAFRGDLFHRIAAVRIRLPVLDARREDLPVLAAHFLAESGVGITATALEVLFARQWPGNVRELRNVVRAAANVARRDNRDRVQAGDIASYEETSPDDGTDGSLRARVVAALAACDGNVTRAARELGMARSGMYETLKRLKLNPTSFRKR